MPQGSMTLGPPQVTGTPAHRHHTSDPGQRPGSYSRSTCALVATCSVRSRSSSLERARTLLSRYRILWLAGIDARGGRGEGDGAEAVPTPTPELWPVLLGGGGVNARGEASVGNGVRFAASGSTKRRFLFCGVWGGALRMALVTSESGRWFEDDDDEAEGAEGAEGMGAVGSVEVPPRRLSRGLRFGDKLLSFLMRSGIMGMLLVLLGVVDIVGV